MHTFKRLPYSEYVIDRQANFQRQTQKAKKEKGVDLPICETVYRVIYDKQDAKEALKALFARSVKNEFAL